MSLKKHLSVSDLEMTARRKLPSGIFGYVSGGAEDQRTLMRNRRAFEDWAFLPRMLAGVEDRSTEVELFGKTYSLPVGIAPMGLAGLCYYRGDLALAEAAAEEKIPFVLSAASTIPLETVLARSPDSWYQAYVPADRGVVEPLLARVEGAGYKVLVVTVDVPVAAQREHELRHGFSVPLRLSSRLIASALARPLWLVQNFARSICTSGVPHFENFSATRGARIIAGPGQSVRSGRAALRWEDIAWVRSKWKGVLVLKGILNHHDAIRAREVGADGVIVSNHGGRQLDRTTASLEALPAVVDVAKGMKVIFDSGISRGTDVLMALALGADFTLVGRAAMFGLAAAGKPGVRHAIQLLRREIDTDLALMGCPDINAISRDFLVAAR
jgi:L-lactate dehydrogenase (cytochrome)